MRACALHAARALYVESNVDFSNQAWQNVLKLRRPKIVFILLQVASSNRPFSNSGMQFSIYNIAEIPSQTCTHTALGDEKSKDISVLLSAAFVVRVTLFDP